MFEGAEAAVARINLDAEPTAEPTEEAEPTPDDDEFVPAEPRDDVAPTRPEGLHESRW